MSNLTKIFIGLVIILVLLILGLFVIPKLKPQPQNSSFFPEEEINEIANPDEENSQYVNLYYILLGDNGEVGEKFGCGDSLVAYPIKINKTDQPLRVALDKLLSEKDQTLEGRYTNTLANSNLEVESISTQEAKTIVKLTGTLSLAGVCDNPRVQKQLEETIKQFEEIDKTEIFINSTPLNQLLSGKGE